MFDGYKNSAFGLENSVANKAWLLASQVWWKLKLGFGLTSLISDFALPLASHNHPALGLKSLVGKNHLN